MKILVCFKIAAELERLSPEEARSLARGTLPLRAFPQSWGAGDEAALECALRLRDEAAARGESARLAAVTLGACPERFGVELRALGFERVDAPERAADGLPPWQTAEGLAAYVKASGGYDLILTGTQAEPQLSGLTPCLLAEMLSLPFVGGVRAVSCAEGGRFLLEAETDTGGAEALVQRPLVAAMENARYPYLRATRLTARLRAAKEGFSPSLPPAAAHARPCEGETLCTVYENAGRACTLLASASLGEQLDALRSALSEGQTEDGV